jgi:outer membrane protein OmpA-like peptidoglycan-associated protein
MKFSLATSLLGLTLLAAPLAAQTADPAPADQQTPAAAEVVAPMALPEELAAFLADQRSAQELSIDELKVRFKTARQFAKDDALPEDVRGQLKAIVEASKAELETRAQAEQQQATPEPKPEAQVAQDAAPAVEPPAAAKPMRKPVEPAPEPAPAQVELPQAVVAVLNDQRPAADLTNEELKKRIQIAHRFAKDPNLPQDVVAQLRAINEAAAVDLQTRIQAQTAKDQAAAEQAAQEQAAKDQAAAELAAQKKAAADQLAAEQAAQQAVTPEVAKPAPPAKVIEPRPLEKPTAVVAPPPPQAPAPENIQKLDANAGDPAAEQQAKAYLADGANLAQLNDDQLRKRLDDVRELLAANELSLPTERAVRTKLKQERDVLRLRLAQAEAAQQAAELQKAPVPQDGPMIARPERRPPGGPVVINVPPPLPPLPGPQPRPRPQTNNGGLNIQFGINIITDLTPPRIVLRDPRRPEELQISELQHRIRAYQEAQADQQYDFEHRNYWQQSLAYDRELLRRRMREERHRREEALAMAAAQNEIDVQIDPYQRPTRKPPRDVFAAEVNDEDMMDVLTAGPAKGLQQRFKVKDIANQQAVRDSVSRIEVDTLRFGYNEGFIREEQLGSLDAIAAIMEKIVKKYPNEVFLIEGHTDAVGSDAYNLKLSKLRAESVKRALSLYYVIPARNLRTVGLGERFLKIPTADAEAENRRVSIARITPLLGLGE